MLRGAVVLSHLLKVRLSKKRRSLVGRRKLSGWVDLVKSLPKTPTKKTRRSSKLKILTANRAKSESSHNAIRTKKKLKMTILKHLNLEKRTRTARMKMRTIRGKMGRIEQPLLRN